MITTYRKPQNFAAHVDSLVCVVSGDLNRVSVDLPTCVVVGDEVAKQKIEVGIDRFNNIIIRRWAEGDRCVDVGVAVLGDLGLKLKVHGSRWFLSLTPGHH